jgi:hypothetical protein
VAAIAIDEAARQFGAKNRHRLKRRACWTFNRAVMKRGVGRLCDQMLMLLTRSRGHRLRPFCIARSYVCVPRNSAGESFSSVVWICV